MSSSTAVLVIDVQNGLVSGSDAVFDSAGLLVRSRALIDRGRAAGVPIVFVQDNDVGPIESAAWKIAPALAPAAADLRIRKPYADSFFQTSLQAELARLGVDRLIVLGCKTDACVDMTARRAVSLGYDVVLAADCHSTTNNQWLAAAQSVAYYNAVLDGFGAEDGFGGGNHAITVQPSHEITW